MEPIEKKAPDYSRHPNVSSEQATEKKVLFSLSHGLSTGEENAFSKAIEESNKVEPGEKWIDLYDKVGGYYRWDYETFMNTPYCIIKALNKKIDEKIENLDDKEKFFSWNMLETALAIARCFGK